MNQGSRVRAVMVGGAIGGTLDILFAISFAWFRGMAPDRLLQTVASGLLGNAAFDGGIPAAVLGLASHFVMSFTWAAIFVLAAGHFRALMRQPILSGIVFGVIVFLTMRLVVLPLSAFPYPLSFRPLATTLDLLSHMLLFGVPIALAARAFAPRPREIA